jgi:hypothetical protein
MPDGCCSNCSGIKHAALILADLRALLPLFP